MLRDILGTKRYYATLLALALPVAMQNLLATGASIIDTLMISGMTVYGEQDLAIASIGVANQFLTLFQSMYYGFMAGGSIFFAQYYGAKDEKGIAKAYGLTLALMMAVGFAFMGTAVFAPEFVMRIYTGDDKVLLREVGAAYLRIVGFVCPFQVMGMVMSTLLRSTEKVKVPMFAAIASSLTKILLNWLLIFGNLGAPALGVSGAAIATLASGAVYPAVLWAYSLFARYAPITRMREQFGWSKGFIKLYCQKSLPIIINEVLYGTGQALINRVLGFQPMAGLAALMVFRSVESFIFAFFGGLSSANSVIVGKDVGAGELDRAHDDAKRMAWQTPLVTFSICLIMIAIRPLIIKGYNMSDEAGGYLHHMLIIFALGGAARAANYIMNNTFRAGGDPVYGSVLEIGFLLIFTVPLVYIVGMALKQPFLMVFSAVYVEELLKLFIGLRHLRSGKYIKPVTEIGRQQLLAFNKKKAAS